METPEAHKGKKKETPEAHIVGENKEKDFKKKFWG